MRCLVTGGAGFIGAHVVNHLIELNYQVVVLDDLSGGFINNVNSKAIFIKGSVEDVDLINKLFEDYRFTFVYHLAAYAAEGLSHFIRNFNYRNNLVGSINLINAAVKHKTKCFVFTSSIAVYGSQTVPMIESAPPQPEDPYGIAKFAVEMDLKAAHKMFGLDYIIFRPHNVYGPYQNIGDKYRNVIGIFMNQLMKGEQLTIFGDGSQTRAFSYIDDVAPYIASSVLVDEAYNEIINIGGNMIYSVRDLAQSVMTQMGVLGEIKYVEARNEVLHAYSDHNKALKLFGIDSNKMVDLNEGLKRMAKWVKTEGIRSSTKFKNIEISKGLPPIWAE